nr:uncharacterized protein LOC109745206 isoform X1 [Aegilops tauschii subsp. strangulata]
MPACCAAAVSPAFGFPRIRRKALFPGLTGRRHPLGSPADAVEGRYVGGLHPPQAAPPYVPHLDGSCPLPPAARRWDLSAARPRAATVQEGDIAVRALLELGRGTGEGRGKTEIIYINLLSSIGNSKYFMSKAPMVQLASIDLTTFMYFILRLFKTTEITSVSKAPMVQLACTGLTTFMYFILSYLEQ